MTSSTFRPAWKSGTEWNGLTGMEGMEWTGMEWTDEWNGPDSSASRGGTRLSPQAAPRPCPAPRGAGRTAGSNGCKRESGAYKGQVRG